MLQLRKSHNNIMLNHIMHSIIVVQVIQNKDMM